MKTKTRKAFAASTHQASGSHLHYIGGDDVNKLGDRQAVIVVTIEAPDEKMMKSARNKLFNRRDLGHALERHETCFEYGYWKVVYDTLASA